MTFILLTGAGFTRNWGGPLAGDVFKGLLADPGVDRQTKSLLVSARGNFESVLADLQQSSDPQDDKRHGGLITAVVGLFNGLNGTLMRQRFEFENPPDVAYSLQSFLSRFDVIFTLNQDALLELHYNPAILPHGGRLHHPGMRYGPNYRPGGTLHDRLASMEPDPKDFTMPTGVQPYVKLHGSVNWVESSAGQRIIVMGGHKSVAIGQFPVLSWYQAEFQKMLLRPDARLMIIGYSFGDAHINQAIVNGLENGLKLFIVDPRGLPAITDHAMFSAFAPDLLGLSDRPISSTFAGDRYEHAQLSKFFAR